MNQTLPKDVEEVQSFSDSNDKESDMEDESVNETSCNIGKKNLIWLTT